jgi:GT2 family glycosyltransferase/glycosyltransferase involved in cell wall biosynthesis
MLFRLRALMLLCSTILLVPFLLIVWLALLFFNLIYSLTGFTRNRVPSQDQPRPGPASIVILNWNGKDLLARGLPSVVEAVRVDGASHEILVVDNGSTDGSLEYLKESFPQVRILALEKNLGFAEGNNAGVRAARNDIVVLLNNDMVVDPGFLSPLLKGFGPKTFAVSSQIYLQDSSKRREETGRTSAIFRRGMIDFSHGEMNSQSYPRSYYPVLWAGGGSSAFHREKFLALGGFQDIYSPAYVEDADLSYQAWRIGWEVLLAPASIVYHMHRASSSRRFSPLQLQALVIRNQFLFLWKNIHSWKLLLSHGAWLPWNCYRLARDHGTISWIALLKAALALAPMEIAKLKFQFRSARTDLQIFELFEKPGLFSRRNSAQKPDSASANGKPRILWVTAYLPHSGRHAGAGRMFQLIKRLSAKYQITLLSFIETDDEKDFIPDLELFCQEVVAFRRTHPPRWNLFAYEPFDEFRTPEMTQVFDRRIENIDFDLIHFEYTQMACYAERVAGIPILLTKHEVDFASCGRRARTESNPATKVRWFYNYLQVLDREIRLTRKVDGVICMTDPDARALRKFLPPIPVYTINTGVDLEYFQPPKESCEAARLIFVGAFQHSPNVDAMLHFCKEMLPIIRREIPGIELLIVGSKPPPVILDLTADPLIHVSGFVPDTRPYMARSSVYIVPLRLGVGIRGKILEAWGMQMPVVSTSVGCAGLRYEHGGNLLVADTPAQFAIQVLTLVRDPAMRRRLGVEGRKTAERYYGWEKSAQQLDTLYQRYIRGGRSSSRQ